jgi:predicted acetyltransferase
MADLRVRDVTESDLSSLLTLRERSFGPLRTGDETWWQQVTRSSLGGRALAVVDAAGTVLGTGRIHGYEQAWGGHHVRMGGIAGVYVEPSARGRGVASLLMRAAITRMQELGDVVSCLYPTTATLYRGVGYEVVATQPHQTYAAQSLRDLRPVGGSPGVRTAGPGDAEQIHALLREHQGRHALSGPGLPTVESWRTQLEDRSRIHYLAEDGFVAYSLADDTLTVNQLVASAPATAAALWAVVGSGSSAAPTVRMYLDPRDPVRLTLGTLPLLDVSEHAWMLRVVDVAAAVAGRGFPSTLSATARLAVADPDSPAGDGLWEVEVERGAGSATRLGPAAYGADAGHASLGPRGLAALWSGWTMSRLRQAGLALGGSADQDAALDSVFACSPFMTEYF